MMKGNKRGQLSIPNILDWVILIFAVGVLSIMTSAFLADISGQENNTVAKIVINSVVPFFWLYAIMTLGHYANPQRPGPF